MKHRQALFAVIGALCVSSAFAEPRFLDSNTVTKGTLPFSEAVQAGTTLYPFRPSRLSPGNPEACTRWHRGRVASDNG